MMRDTSHNMNYDTEEESEHHIPQANLIPYLRTFFTLNNPNFEEQMVRIDPLYYDYLQNARDEDEDKEENEFSYDEYDDILNTQLRSRMPGFIMQRGDYREEREESSQDKRISSSDKEDNEYIDFRVYPLKIDWKKIANHKTSYYDTMKLHGYFGVALLTSLAQIEGITIIHANKFIYSFVTFYDNLVHHSSDNGIKEFMAHLPSLESIKFVIDQSMVNKKEIICMKIVIDIYRHYLMSSGNSEKTFSLKQYYIPTALSFYSYLNDQDVTFIYDSIQNKMKKTRVLLKKLKCKVMKRKDQYLKKLKKMEKDSFKLIEGVNLSYFIQ